jgi:tRNA U34 5-carboxymethylaminomethyl modifying enzyme MnmG/GidA
VPDEYDVMVIGAGPTGENAAAATAHWARTRSPHTEPAYWTAATAD